MFEDFDRKGSLINHDSLISLVGVFVNEKFCILIKISLKFVPKGPIDNKQELI